VGFRNEGPDAALVLNVDGTGTAPCKLAPTKNLDGSEPCSIEWSVDGRALSIKRSKGLMQSEWHAFLSGGKLHISTATARLEKKTGKVQIYAGNESLELKEGECTHRYNASMDPHTGPCHFTEDHNRLRLDYEAQGFDKKITAGKLYWYKDAGVLSSEPIHTLQRESKPG
jgi:hypothetical protein